MERIVYIEECKSGTFKLIAYGEVTLDLLEAIESYIAHRRKEAL